MINYILLNIHGNTIVIKWWFQISIKYTYNKSNQTNCDQFLKKSIKLMTILSECLEEGDVLISDDKTRWYDDAGNYSSMRLQSKSNFSCSHGLIHASIYCILVTSSLVI